jgi:hypothetical protein
VKKPPPVVGFMRGIADSVPALVAHIEARKGRRRSFGGIDVIELSPEDAGADAPR